MPCCHSRSTLPPFLHNTCHLNTQSLQHPVPVQGACIYCSRALAPAAKLTQAPACPLHRHAATAEAHTAYFPTHSLPVEPPKTTLLTCSRCLQTLLSRPCACCRVHTGPCPAPSTAMARCRGRLPPVHALSLQLSRACKQQQQYRLLLYKQVQ
jgi:hypothetical protein